MKHTYTTSMLAPALMAPSGLGSAAPLNEGDGVPIASNGPGLTGHTALVHKRDADGTLLIDAFTGAVLPDQDKPEWAENLALAQLTERHQWYTARLGQEYADQHKNPEVFAYEDLGWLGLDDEQETMSIDADEEFRMEVLQTVLGITDEGEIPNTLVEIELIHDNKRTGAEMQDFYANQDQGFDEVKRSGTGG